jgi:hypothetical protein
MGCRGGPVLGASIDGIYAAVSKPNIVWQNRVNIKSPSWQAVAVRLNPAHFALSARPRVRAWRAPRRRKTEITQYR